MTTDTADPRALGEELEAALCASTWAQSLAHVHAAIEALARQSSSTGEVTQEEDARLFREQLATLLEEDGRPKSAEAVGDEDEGIAITSGHAFKAFARHRHRFASPQTAGGVGELVEDDLSCSLDYYTDARMPELLRAYVADLLIVEAEEHVAREARAIVLLASERFASLTAERDAALVRCEEMRGALGKARDLIECVKQTRGYWWVDATDPETAVCDTDTAVRAALGDGGGG